MVLAGDVAVEILTGRANNLDAMLDLRTAQALIGEIHNTDDATVIRFHMDAKAEETGDLLIRDPVWKAVEQVANELVEQKTLFAKRVRVIIQSARESCRSRAPS